MEQDIPYIIANKKRRSGSEEAWNYSLLLVPLLLIFLGGISFYFSINDPTDKLPLPKNIMIVLGIALVLLCIVLFRFTLKRLRENVSFKSIPTPYSHAENYKIAADILQQFKGVTEQFPEYLCCDTAISLLSWGEQILIVPLDKELLINSHSNKQPLTLVKDVSNIRKFEQLLTDTINNRR